MILLEMRLHNFRQFYGDSPVIHFASGRKNVTVFHGANGAGKTALLNAFTWTLYDSVTRGFLFEDQIVNKRALREAAPGETVSASVEITFEHLGRKYLVKKSCSGIRGATESDFVLREDPVKTLQWSSQDGKWKSEISANDVIGRVLPKDLHSYFFFDGERIERIVQPTGEEQGNIANATKKLLGLEVLDRGGRHLLAAKKALERELEAIADQESKKLLQEKAECEETLRRAEEKAAQVERNIQGHRLRQSELQDRLRRLDSVRADQARRDQLNADKETHVTSLKASQDQLRTLLSSQSYKVFLDDVSSSYLTLIESLRVRGELPSGIKRQFVDDLLQSNVCICGSSLDAHTASEARSRVEGWRARAGLADVEEKAIRMGGEVRRVEMERDAFWTHLEDYQRRITADREEIRRIDDALDEIHRRLEGSPREEVSQLERQLRDTTDAIERENQEKGNVAADARQLGDRIVVLERAISKHRANEEKQRLAQRRIDAVREAIDRLSESRARFEEHFRSTLTAKVRHLFGKISYTPYVPELTPTYSLQLLESAGGTPLPVAASQGENQILSLAFIGAVIDVARDYTKRQEKLPGPDTSTYPMVMDSPFGSLGPNYRTQVSEKLSLLADQIVVMVTNTQWLGEVEEALKEKVGRAYVITYFSPRNDIPEESIAINGRKYDLVEQSGTEFEYSMMREATSD